MHFKDIYITYGKKDGKIMFLLRDKMNFLQKIALISVENEQIQYYQVLIKVHDDIIHFSKMKA
jgi:hypothetical protein